MANYYYTTIKSDKMTQKIAAEIFNKLAEERKIRYFDYDENQLKKILCFLGADRLSEKDSFIILKDSEV